MNPLSGSASREIRLRQVYKEKDYTFMKKTICLRGKELHRESTVVGNSYWKENSEQFGWR